MLVPLQINCLTKAYQFRINAYVKLINKYDHEKNLSENYGIVSMMMRKVQVKMLDAYFQFRSMNLRSRKGSDS